MDLSKMFLYNPFAKYFKVSRPEEDRKDEEALENSQGISSEELLLGRIGDYEAMSQPGSSLTYVGIQFEQYFANKTGRIGKYREMSLYPEISDALDTICDEAIIPNTDGDIVTLEIEEEMPAHIEEEVRDIWHYLVGEVFAFKDRGWDFFRKWLVEAELYIELVLNAEGTDIIDIKVLPNHTMLPVYEENKIVAYMQQAQPRPVENLEGDPNYKQPANIMFDKGQVVYSNYGLYGTNQLDVRGFLDPAIRTYNQLKSLEDAVVVYRLVRAPERRIWNIAVGRMPKGKAEEYIKGVIQRYKKRIVYDPETGAMNAALNVQSLTEDFWFARNEEGEGTSVETIGGGMNLGEIDDVNYFLKKLYKTLKLPSSRWQDVGDSNYSAGKSGEITREEIKFSRFIERLQGRFKYILLDAFITLLRLRGIDERYVDHSFYNVLFTESNLFKAYKELELTESRFAALTTMSEFIYDPEANANGFFSREFCLRNYFLMTDEEWAMNKKMLEQEKQAAASAGMVPGGLDAGMGLGGPGGGLGGGGLGGGGFGGADLGGGDLGGLGEPAAEFGAESGGAEVTPAVGGELAGAIPTGTAGESTTINFDDPKNTSTVMKEWLDEDNEIHHKYDNEGFFGKNQ